MKVKNSFLIGDFVELHNATIEDTAGDWFRWLNDPEVNSLIGRYPMPNSSLDQKNYLESIKKNKSRLILSIKLKKSKKMIGVVSLSKLDNHHRNSESSIIIGNVKYRTGVHALESLALLTEFGFTKLNLNRIYSSTLIINEGAHNLNAILGWRKVGVCKKSHFYNGNYVDSIIYEILRDWWLRSKKDLYLKMINFLSLYFDHNYNQITKFFLAEEMLKKEF